MNIFFEFLIISLTGICLSLKLLALWSWRKSAACGLIEGKLAPNKPSPNSVCSEGRGANIEPLAGATQRHWQHLKDIIQSEARIITDKTEYLHAVYRTPILGFEDDLEARLDTERQVIHLRSASRVGYSDRGVNKKRVDNIRHLID